MIALILLLTLGSLMFYCIAEVERTNPFDPKANNYQLFTSTSNSLETSSSESSSTVDPCLTATPDVQDDIPGIVYPPEDIRFGDLDFNHLEWTSTDDATHYRVQISTDATYASANVLVDERISATDPQTYSIDTTYAKNLYYWRVRSERDITGGHTCVGSWSDTTAEIAFTHVNTFAGGGTSGTGELRNPRGIAYNPSDGNLYVTHSHDDTTGFVRIFSTTGSFVGDIPATSDPDMYYPVGIACDSSGNIFVVENDALLPEIKKYDISKTEQGSFSLSSTPSYHWDIEVDSNGNVYAASSNELHSFDNNLGTHNSITMSEPIGLAIGGLPEVLYIGFQSPNFIQRRDAGTLVHNPLANSISSEGTGPWQFSNVYGVASDIDGKIYLADISNPRVHVFNADGSPYGYFGTEGSGDMQWQGASNKGPYDLTVDTSGSIYVIDQAQHRIQRIDQ